jgi:predicted membrane GTPase involved in stress response
MPVSYLPRLCVALAIVLISTECIAQPFAELRRFRGAWVPEGTTCKSVFSRQGSAIHFRRPGTTVREGILIDEKNRIEDARNRCHVKKIKASGEAHSLLISCLSGLVVSNLSFSVQFIDDDTVVRSVTEFPEEKVRLRRCKI